MVIEHILEELFLAFFVEVGKEVTLNWLEHALLLLLQHVLH